MARPRRDPIEALKAKLFMRLIALRLDIPPSGSGFSFYFDGTKRNSSKWKRYLDGNKCPSLGTRNQIFQQIRQGAHGEGLTQELSTFWNSPIWAALVSSLPSENDWTEFYKTLPLDLQRHVFVRKVVNNNPYDRRSPRKSEIIAVEKKCTLDALAFLCALTRESTHEKLRSNGLDSELSLYRLLLAFFRHEPFKSHWRDIWHYVKQHVVSQDRRLAHLFGVFRWEETTAQIEYFLGLDTHVINLAKQIGWEFTELQERQFIMFCHILGYKKVCIELSLISNKHPTNLPTITKLAKRINSLRIAKHKVAVPPSPPV